MDGVDPRIGTRSMSARTVQFHPDAQRALTTGFNQPTRRFAENRDVGL